MAEKDNYENLPLSEKTLEGSRFNIDDLKIMKVLNDRQDEVIKQYISDTYDTHACLIIGEVRKMLDEIKLELNKIHLEIREIRIEIRDINLDIENLTNRIADHEFRILGLEKHVKDEKQE